MDAARGGGNELREALAAAVGAEPAAAYNSESAVWSGEHASPQQPQASRWGVFGRVDVWLLIVAIAMLAVAIATVAVA
jgi:hypothetical protein